MKTRQKIRTTLLLVSFLAFPATFFYLSPVIPFFAAMKGIVTGSIIVFAGLFLISLFAGRIFCGWLCPAGALQEFALNVPGKKPPKKAWIVKYVIWWPWIFGLIFMFRNAGGVKDIDFFYLTEKGVSVSDPYSLFTFLIVAGFMLLIALVFGRRASCHTICWMAPFMVAGRKASVLLHIPRLKLTSKSDICTSCGTCERKCPMSLPVTNMAEKNKMEHSDCILCGNCVDNCPKSVISYKFKT